jgi:hypothetical protein
MPVMPRWSPEWHWSVKPVMSVNPVIPGKAAMIMEAVLAPHVAVPDICEVSLVNHI